MLSKYLDFFLTPFIVFAPHCLPQMDYDYGAGEFSLEKDLENELFGLVKLIEMHLEKFEFLTQIFNCFGMLLDTWTQW